MLQAYFLSNISTPAWFPIYSLLQLTTHNALSWGERHVFVYTDLVTWIRCPECDICYANMKHIWKSVSRVGMFPRHTSIALVRLKGELRLAS